MIVVVPKNIFFVKGVGKHKEKLESFEAALRDAGIEKYNLVSVSSILPPRCKIISEKQGLKKLNPGQIIFLVMAKKQTNESGRLIASSIGLAIPKDRKNYGYLSEYHSLGQTEKKAGHYAEKMARTMLATKLKIKHARIAKTRNITAAARGSKRGLWTTTVAAAVFC